MDTCFVTAKLTAKKGMEAQLEAEVVKNIPNVRAEKGCIRYDFHKNRSEDGTFLFYEIWESPEALDAHGKTPHMLAYKERTKELLACPTGLNMSSSPWPRRVPGGTGFLCCSSLPKKFSITNALILLSTFPVCLLDPFLSSTTAAFMNQTF